MTSSTKRKAAKGKPSQAATAAVPASITPAIPGQNPTLSSADPTATTGPMNSKTVKFFRELFETFVVVVLSVTLLRLYSAEAFVIPTGSMAVTLLGAHKYAYCPECGHYNKVSASDEMDRNPGFSIASGGLCQNCQHPFQLQTGWGNQVVLPGQPGTPLSGDRLVVAKYLYEFAQGPKRWEVPVFICPDVPQKTYIKRCVGLPNEKLRLRLGDIYIQKPDQNDFQIVSKPPLSILACRRLVFDSDLQPKDWLAGNYPSRWYAQLNHWQISPDRKTYRITADAASGSLAYRHLTGGGDRQGSDQPIPITDFEAYNLGLQDAGNHVQTVRTANRAINWVGDLILECQYQANATGEFGLELGEGNRRYLCKLHLPEQEVTLSLGSKELARQKLAQRLDGSHHIRFANVDDRLVVWLDETLLFGDGVPVPVWHLDNIGPTQADLTPAKLTATNCDITVTHLKLFRDIYYTQRLNHYEKADAELPELSELQYQILPRITDQYLERWRQGLVRSWDRGTVYQMGPDEYFMLGDNSPSSADSRAWQQPYVSQKYILGRAMAVYWPIRNWQFVH